MWPEASPLVHIDVAGRQIARMLSGVTESDFADDAEKQFACQYLLVIVGESVKRLPPDFRASHPHVLWTEIAGLRDLLVHAYHRISALRIWQICTEDVPVLLAYIEPLLPPEPSPGSP